MKPNWQKLASLAQDICTLLFQFFSAVFASKGYPFKNIFQTLASEHYITGTCMIILLNYSCNLNVYTFGRYVVIFLLSTAMFDIRVMIEYPHLFQTHFRVKHHGTV